MGVRKRNSAKLRKEAKKKIAFAKLNNCPTSPRKMRLIADLIRGMDVERALSELKLNPKEASGRMEKLLLSALANWEAKNEGKRMDEGNLYVSEVKVDSGRMLKRVQPAPQGRAHRIRKRSNHVTLVVDSRNTDNNYHTPDFYYIKHFWSLTWDESEFPKNLSRSLLEFCKKDKRNKNNKFWCEIYDNVFLHLRGGSGWIKEMKGKLDNSVLEDCLKSLY